MNKNKNHQNPRKRDKQTQTIRFLKWINRYPGWWYLICTPDEDHMTLEMMKMLIKRLAKKQFYDIIFVLLSVHRNAAFMDVVFKSLLLKMILSDWKGKSNGKDRFVHDITELLT